MRLTYEQAEALRGDPEFQAFCEAIEDAHEPCTFHDTADVFASLKAAGLLRSCAAIATPRIVRSEPGGYAEPTLKERK